MIYLHIFYFFCLLSPIQSVSLYSSEWMVSRSAKYTPEKIRVEYWSTAAPVSCQCHSTWTILISQLSLVCSVKALNSASLDFLWISGLPRSPFQFIWVCFTIKIIYILRLSVSLPMYVGGYILKDRVVRLADLVVLVIICQIPTSVVTWGCHLDHIVVIQHSWW